MRLIDADTLMDEANSDGAYGYVDAKQISEAPTVDAVPVARCEKCVHYEMGVRLKIYDDGAASRYAWQERKPDDFCSYGERKGCADNGVPGIYHERSYS